VTRKAQSLADFERVLAHQCVSPQPIAGIFLTALLPFFSFPALLAGPSTIPTGVPCFLPPAEQ
jgi:hypothetical protein